MASRVERRLCSSRSRNVRNLRCDYAPLLCAVGWLTDKSPVVAPGAAENTESRHKDAVFSVPPCEQIRIDAFCQSIRQPLLPQHTATISPPVMRANSCGAMRNKARGVPAAAQIASYCIRSLSM